MARYLRTRHEWDVLEWGPYAITSEADTQVTDADAANINAAAGAYGIPLIDSPVPIVETADPEPYLVTAIRAERLAAEQARADAQAAAAEAEGFAGTSNEQVATFLTTPGPTKDAASASYGRLTSTDGTVLTGLGVLPAPTGVGVELVFTADGLDDIRINGASA